MCLDHRIVIGTGAKVDDSNRTWVDGDPQDQCPLGKTDFQTRRFTTTGWQSIYEHHGSQSKHQTQYKDVFRDPHAQTSTSTPAQNGRGAWALNACRARLRFSFLRDVIQHIFLF